MKIAFVTTYDAEDISSWSGTPYFMAKAFIDEGVQVEYIGNLGPPERRSHISAIKEKIYNRLLKKRFGEYYDDYDPAALKHYANQVKKRLENSEADVVFSPGALPVAYLDIDKPVVVWTDATFAVMHNYYDGFKNFSFASVRDCHRYERNVLKRVSLAVFSSTWAAESAVKNYGAPGEIVKVVPYGANIPNDRSVIDILGFNKLKSRNVCRLLFVGREWIRKGGPEALAIAKELNDLNITTELTIVGSTPPESSAFPSYVKVLGFVDKSKQEGKDLIDRVYRESHFFVLPTMADCTPIVFCEANSYGLPVITTKTGGIPSIIRDDVNGKMFELSLNPKKCAGYIADIFTDYERYEKLSIKSFDLYLKELNWKVSAAKIIRYLEEILIKQ